MELNLKEMNSPPGSSNMPGTPNGEEIKEIFDEFERTRQMFMRPVKTPNPTAF